jgi:hypothetical protein
MLSIPKKVLLALVAVLAAVSLLLAWAVQDPARAQVREAFFGYLGDLRQGLPESASHRVLPADMAALKQAALERVGSDPLFRSDAEAFFARTDPAELVALPKEKFFEFLLARTLKQHPAVRDVLAEGKVVGTGVRRSGGEADLTATLALDTPEGRRMFTMRLHLTRMEDIWFLRL